MAPHRSPYFFKILLDPNAPHLPLPPDFVTLHLDNKIPKQILIRSANGGHSWRLKIAKIGESFCLSDGWDIVVRDIQLGFGDFLVFRFLDKSVLKMVVFSPNGCEKDFPPKTHVDDDSGVVNDDVEDLVVDDDEELVVEDDEDIVVEDVSVDDEDEVEDEEDEDDDDDDDDDEEEEDDYVEERDDGDDDEDDGDDDGIGGIDGDEGDPFFVLVISKSHKTMMRLPADFAELAGIDGEGTLTVANLDGKEWQMGVRADTRNPKLERYYISAGWLEFRRSNNLLEGDECVFTFIKSEDKLLLARVTKKRRRARLPKTNPTVETPVKEVAKRLREQPKQNSNETPVKEVAKRLREQPKRNSNETPVKEVVKRLREQPKRNSGETPVNEVVKRLRTRNSCETPVNEVVKRLRVQPKRNSGETTVAAVGKRGRARVARDNGGTRPRGRPANRRRGKPARRK